MTEFVLSSSHLILEFIWPNQPSSYLINALLSLISSLNRLGLSRSALVTNGVTVQIVQDFQSAVAQKVSMDCAWGRDETQLLWDLSFLRKKFSASTQDFIGANDLLTQKLSQLYEQVRCDIFLQRIYQYIFHFSCSR